MSDGKTADDHRWQRKKARNRQNAAMWRGDLPDNPWPPEGTRVRIVGTLEDGSTGRIDSDGRGHPEQVRWVKLDLYRAYWPVYRHEIEVIDGS